MLRKYKPKKQDFFTTEKKLTSRLLESRRILSRQPCTFMTVGRRRHIFMKTLSATKKRNIKMNTKFNNSWEATRLYHRTLFFETNLTTKKTRLGWERKT